MNRKALLFGFGLALVLAGETLHAQQNDADRKLLDQIRAKAEGGEVQSQFELGCAYGFGNLGVTKDQAEAVKWFRKAAELDHPSAQYNLASHYYDGEGVAKNDAMAVKWFRKAAELNHTRAQYNLGVHYNNGEGVTRNPTEAAKWFRKAAEQHLAPAQRELARCYYKGKGVQRDYAEAVKWFYAAATANDAEAQLLLSGCYFQGAGVIKDFTEAYKWTLLAAAQGYQAARTFIASLENVLTMEQIAEGQKLARNFKPRKALSVGSDRSGTSSAQARPVSSGSGFFITEDGYLITNQHVAGNGAQVRLVTTVGLLSAKVVKVDAGNDLSLLKVEGRFVPLPVIVSRSARLGSTVATVGFPNIGLQGFAPKLAKGEIASLSGMQDDTRYFQISVPVQPGNSGGALVDEHGNVVGVVAAKLSARAALAASGALPENVNYAVKSSFLLSFLESVPEVAAKLKEPETKERKFEDVVKSAEQAAVLVLVY